MLENIFKRIIIADAIILISSIFPSFFDSSVESENEIIEYIRSKAETAYHPSCTLKMGVDDMAVVDEKLRIYGLKNIRVADASVMPEITSGNLNAPTLMIGERAADFILNS